MYGRTIVRPNRMTTTTISDPKATVLPLLEGGTWPRASEALAQVTSLPIPGTKTEAWKYTRVARLFNSAYTAPNAQANVELPERLPFPATRFVFVNGHFRADLSDALNVPVGKVIGALGQHFDHPLVKQHYGTLAPVNERLFSAMNTARPTDGLVLVLPQGAALQQPLHVLHLTVGSTQLVQPRDLIVLQNGATAEIFFEHVSGPDAQGSLINGVRECLVGQGASLTIHKLQRDAERVTNISDEQVHVYGDGRYSIDTITLGNGLVRNDLGVSLAGPQAHAELSGAYLLNGMAHCDNHTYIGHDVPDCTSDELYKGIMAGKGTGVFNGKVYVKQDAQRTRAYQSNANILQGDDAKVFTKPELEIYADDVKCSHGCTIGRLDEKGLFYLRSRGVSETEARRMLAHAFMTDVLERIGNEDWRKHLAGLIDAKLEVL